MSQLERPIRIIPIDKIYNQELPKPFSWIEYIINLIDEKVTHGF